MTGPPGSRLSETFQAADNLAPIIVVRSANGEPAGCVEVARVVEMIERGWIKPLGARKLKKLYTGKLEYVQFTKNAPWRQPEKYCWAGRDNTRRIRNDWGIIIAAREHLEHRPLPRPELMPSCQPLVSTDRIDAGLISAVAARKRAREASLARSEDVLPREEERQDLCPSQHI